MLLVICMMCSSGILRFTSVTLATLAMFYTDVEVIMSRRSCEVP